MRDAVDDLIWDEAPQQAAAVAVLDAPALVTDALTLTDDVRVFCDDWRAAAQVPEGLLVDHPSELAGVDLVLARLPKSLAALDEQALWAQGASEVTFLGGARVRHMNHSMNEVLGKHFVAVAASLGRSKSRVLRAWGPQQRVSDWPKSRVHDDLGIRVCAHGATFGGTKIDPGTRLLLSALGERLTGQKVLDFGCGNGTIAMWLAMRGSHTTACDVSWSAVTSTRAAAQANGVEIEVLWHDGLIFPDKQFDAIVTNPPFHRGQAKDTSDTLTMFDQAANVLVPGGQLWCVYNSHLPYRKELNIRTGPTKVVAQDRHYTVTKTVVR